MYSSGQTNFLARPMYNKNKSYYNLRKMFDLIIQAYKKSENRILFLDYDGTLVSYTKMPSEANIGEDTFAILEQLSMDLKNSIFIISGRDMGFLERQFTGLNVNLIAEHGFRIKEIKKSWVILPNLSLKWKEDFKKFFQGFVSMMPGSFIEEKEASIAFHYRNIDKEVENKTLPFIKEKIKEMMTDKPDLEILDGNKVVEIKKTAYNKGTMAATILKRAPYDFILAAGDDVTDETLFRELKNNAFTIKIGSGNTLAKYRIDEPKKLMTFLSELINVA